MFCPFFSRDQRFPLLLFVMVVQREQSGTLIPQNVAAIKPVTSIPRRGNQQIHSL